MPRARSRTGSLVLGAERVQQHLQERGASSAPIAKLMSTLTLRARENETAAANTTDSSPPTTLAPRM
jgi:hypothetical protein